MHLRSIIGFLYKYIDTGKKLVPGRDAVLIVGGTMSKTGWNVCNLLVRRYNVEVINIDSKCAYSLLKKFSVIDSDQCEAMDLLEEQMINENDLANQEEAQVDDSLAELVLEGGLEQLYLEADEAKLLHPYRSSGNYTFIECRDLADSKCVIDAMLMALATGKRITVFINNLQEGLYSKCLENGGYVDSLEFFEKCTNTNVTNAIIATKYFISEFIPTINTNFGPENDYYIVNFTVDPRNQKLLLPASYFTTKAAIRQLHDGLYSEKSIYETTSKIKTLLVRIPETPANVDLHMERFEQIADLLIKNLKLGRAGTYNITATIFTNILADFRQFLDQLQY